MTAKELLALPESARREYTLYRWDKPLGSRRTIQGMVDTLRHQLTCFERSLPVGTNGGPDAVRALCRTA